MSQHVVLLADSVSTHHLSGVSCDLDGLHTVVSLKDGDHLDSQLTSFFQPSHMGHCLLPQRDVCGHLSQFGLNELE